MGTRLADGTRVKSLRCVLALVLSLSLLSACTPGVIKPTPVARAVPAGAIASGL
jgi:hypothetical protein